MNVRFTISGKLLALSGIALFFVILEGVAGYVAVHSLADATRQIRDDGAALKYQMQADQAHDALRADVMASLLQGDVQTGGDARKDLEEHADEFQSALRELEQLPLDPQTRAAVKKLRPVLDEYLASASSVVLLALKDKAQAQARMGAYMSTFRKVEREMGELSELIARRSKDIHAESARAASMAVGGIVTAMVLCGAVLLVASLLIGRSIVSRVRRAVQIAETVGRGDFSSHIEERDGDEAAQLLQALARMNGSLVQLVGTTRVAGGSMARGSSQVAMGIPDLSRGFDEHVLQQAAASMEQIDAMIRSNADSTQQASSMAATASASAARGGEAVKMLVTTMSGITEASRRITDIIGVIDDIAFQTNILALNASAEAARAGEQGRGLAVMAAEVRALAQRSAAAAQEIKGLIHTSAEQVSAGARQASHAGESLGDVVRQVRHMTLLLADIARATQEHNKYIPGPGQPATPIGQATQGNASPGEDPGDAADSAHRQATRLVDAVSQFRLDRGDSSPPLPA